MDLGNSQAISPTVRWITSPLKVLPKSPGFCNTATTATRLPRRNRPAPVSAEHHGSLSRRLPSITLSHRLFGLLRAIHSTEIYARSVRQRTQFLFSQFCSSVPERCATAALYGRNEVAGGGLLLSGEPLFAGDSAGGPCKSTDVVQRWLFSDTGSKQRKFPAVSGQSHVVVD